MKEYLSTRARYYVLEELNINSLSKYNSVYQYTALLERITSLSENIDRSLSFMEENTPDVEDSIETAIYTLETKVQIIRDSLQFINKIKMDLNSTGTSSDISIVDLSRCSFSNMNYSVTDRGVVLSSVTTIHLKESV
jgi:hypothetical protein